jgi:hypothetical protein
VTDVRIVLPAHLRTLARVTGEVRVSVVDDNSTITQGAVLDALEEAYPVLRGTIREHGTLRRRSFVRYFAGEADLSHEPAETPLPPAVVSGREPFCIVGAMAGG